MELQTGQNANLTQNIISINIETNGVPNDIDLDLCAFMLSNNDKTLNDSGMIFYGASKSPDQSINLNVSKKEFEVDLSKVPSSITKLAFAITIDKGISRGQYFSKINKIKININNSSDNYSYIPDLNSMSETALILAEIYKKNDLWKIRAVGQGFNGGLGPLAMHYGIAIDNDPDKDESLLKNKNTDNVIATNSTEKVIFTKVTLEKAKPVSLEKTVNGQFGEIIVNLRWTKDEGIFSKGIDLDLGAMVELQNGSKHVVQALGNLFGDLNHEPFVMLLGDDRSGQSGDGEFLQINGNQWKSIKRVLIYAFIYEGTPNWSRADGSISIRMPGQPELVAKLDSSNNSDIMCAVALLENNEGSIRATKYVDYFLGHEQLDRRFGFGFDWIESHK